MPWNIVKGGGTCSADEWAVIKESDGTTEGCHATKQKAREQQKALYANEEDSMALNQEHRGFAGWEVRTDGEDDKSRFVGLATPFNSRTAIGNPLVFGFYEEMDSGAFTDTLLKDDQRFLIDHNPFYVVSRSSAGTLDIKTSKRGLEVDSALDGNLSYVSDLRANLENGNIDGMSIGFFVLDDDWSTEDVETDDGHKSQVEVRTVKKAQLLETSAVTFPAYTDTEAGLRERVSTALAVRDALHPETHKEAVELSVSARRIRENKRAMLSARYPHLEEAAKNA